jgi:hypothetical protein
MQDDASGQPLRFGLPLRPRLAILLVAALVGVLCAASDEQTGSRRMPLVVIGFGLLVVAAAYLWLTPPRTVARWRDAWIGGYWFQRRARPRSEALSQRRRRGAGKPGRDAMARRQGRRR